MKAIVTVGISASGKSTYANELVKQGWMKIERDEIRREMFNFKQWSEYKFTKTKEQLVTEVVDDTIAGAAFLGANIIISDTNLNPKFRTALIEKLVGYGYEVGVKAFPISLEEAWKRDESREYSVGRDVIYKQWKQWNEFIGRKKHEPNTSLPNAVICDIDGTIAQMHNRGPFEWDKVGQDFPRLRVMDIVDKYAQNCNVICVSGRDEVCRNQTKEWLDLWRVSYNELLMRKAGDCRKDTIVKEEIFWEDIADYYNVVAVIDDRPSVVRMWWDIGIPNVICVGNPWEEF